jgi:hypothetical protein
MDLRERKWQEKIGEDCIIRNFIICTVHTTQGDQVKKNRTGGECSTCEKNEKGT